MLPTEPTLRARFHGTAMCPPEGYLRRPSSRVSTLGFRRLSGPIVTVDRTERRGAADWAGYSRVRRARMGVLPHPRPLPLGEGPSGAAEPRLLGRQRRAGAPRLLDHPSSSTSSVMRLTPESMSGSIMLSAMPRMKASPGAVVRKRRARRPPGNREDAPAENRGVRKRASGLATSSSRRGPQRQTSR